MHVLYSGPPRPRAALSTLPPFPKQNTKTRLKPLKPIIAGNKILKRPKGQVRQTPSTTGQKMYLSILENFALQFSKIDFHLNSSRMFLTTPSSTLPASLLNPKMRALLMPLIPAVALRRHVGTLVKLRPYWPGALLGGNSWAPLPSALPFMLLASLTLSLL